MEEELRYYYGFDKYETLIEKLKKYNELEKNLLKKIILTKLKSNQFTLH